MTTHSPCVVVGYDGSPIAPAAVELAVERVPDGGSYETGLIGGRRAMSVRVGINGFGPDRSRHVAGRARARRRHRVGRHQRAHGRRDGGRSINAGVAERADRGHLAGIFGYSDEPLVSGDIVGCSYSGVFDAGLTSVVGGTQAEVVAWNDNE